MFFTQRGNLNTRIRKLDDKNGDYSAIILAVAGLKRLKWDDRISQYLDCDVSYHAVSQGALGVECREGDEIILKVLQNLTHIPTKLSCLAERAMLRKLRGGCGVPIGVNSNWDGDKLTLTGIIVNLDGTRFIEASITNIVNSDQDADELGTLVGDELFKKGADKILKVVFIY